MQVLINKNMFDAVFIDEISHYSNEYAAKLSGKPIYKFSHRDDADLEEKISINLQPGKKLFNNYGRDFPYFRTIAPIDKYSRIIEKYSGILWVDDAHVLGILG